MAAPNPPVNVHIPAGPATPDSRIYVDAGDDIVSMLPWLAWDPSPAMGVMPRVSLTNDKALAAFAIKCQLDKSPRSSCRWSGDRPFRRQSMADLPAGPSA